jgi:HK97 family phage prohead protease
LSEALDIREQETERAERPVLRRTFQSEMSAGDGRTIDVRIVPFGERAWAADGYGGLPKGEPYQEEFMPGAFGRQLNAANRVLLNFEHQSGIAGIVGHGIELREESDAYYGSFRIHDSADGDKALMLTREKILGAVSVEAIPLKTMRTRDGIVQRVKAHLDKVALCRAGAYESALVLALRAEDPVVDNDVILDEELFPVDLNPELVERLRATGISLPDRYQKAHPAETDTPAETGTSDDGTRQTEENAESEE